MNCFSSLLLGIVCLISALFLWFRQHAVARPKPSPSPAATSWSKPLPAVTSWSKPLPAATSWSKPLPAATSWSTPLPAATSWSKPLPAATSWSTPLPAVPAWPSSTYGLTHRSSLSNSGMLRELQKTYGSNERLFGEFQCPMCNRKWASGNSWANTKQECKNCRIMVSPYHQRRLDMPAQETYTRDLTKPHLTEMCEMCKRLGRDCSRRW